VVLILGAAIAARHLNGTAFRYVFWIALGLAARPSPRRHHLGHRGDRRSLVLLAIKGGREDAATVKEPGRRRASRRCRWAWPAPSSASSSAR
jgi:hypothetical protein